MKQIKDKEYEEWQRYKAEKAIMRGEKVDGLTFRLNVDGLP